jgi:hypothetical protein
VETREGVNLFDDALRKIAICYAEFSDSYSAEDIAEGFVTKSDSETNLASIQGLRDFSSIFFWCFHIFMLCTYLYIKKSTYINLIFISFFSKMTARTSMKMEYLLAFLTMVTLLPILQEQVHVLFERKI